MISGIKGPSCPPRNLVHVNASPSAAPLSAATPVTMSNDLVNLKLKKLAGDEDEENGTLTLKPHPPPTEPATARRPLCELREPQLTNDQTQTQTQIGTLIAQRHTVIAAARALLEYVVPLS